MGRTVKELLATIDSREISEWQAYKNLAFFEKRIADNRVKEMNTDQVSNLLEEALFGKAKAKAKRDGK